MFPISQLSQLEIEHFFIFFHKFFRFLYGEYTGEQEGFKTDQKHLAGPYMYGIVKSKTINKFRILSN
ncbi:hypothetical protein TE101_19880 [Alteromonas macleodii]|nr:hypothetical protein TE101_19880 [Alteromonas macleodii]